MQLPINAIFFWAYSTGSLLAVVLHQEAVPLLGYDAVFYFLGFMTIAALLINQFVSTTFDTFMPFVSDHADEEGVIGNAVLTKFVDRVWLHYDTDENGSLDATETREFVDKILCSKKDRLSQEQFMENFD